MSELILRSQVLGWACPARDAYWAAWYGDPAHPERLEPAGHRAGRPCAMPAARSLMSRLTTAPGNDRMTP